MSPSLYQESRPQDKDEEQSNSEPTSDAPLSRRGWGKHLLLSASALAVLFASNKPAEVQAAPVTDTWKLGGNANVSTNGTNFIGPTNSAALIFKIAGVERMRINEAGNIGIGTTSPNAELRADASSGTAVYGRHAATTGDAAAVRGDTNSTVTNASAMYGLVTSTAPGTGSAGVWGDNASTDSNGSGVRATHASGGYGVYATAGTSGYGVYASGGYNGVYGSGGNYGVIAYGNASGSYGVYGSGAQTGLYGSGGSYGVFGTSSSGYGVYGSGGTGVFGTSSVGTAVYGTSSGSNGVYGYTSDTDSVGVFGNGGGYGLYGVYGVSGRTAGVRGNSGYVGVWGEATTYGVFGKATSTSASSYGVYGAAGSTSGYAGYFSGKVGISGTLSKGGGSFKIDHPLDPTNKYLYHSFVESPDMMNIYNGNVTLDAKGEAIVTMPNWFEALNQEFRYQLTAIGASGPNLFIADEIKGNRFRIAGGKGGMKVSWQVTGVRHDAFAKANRIPVEEQKPSAERGRYLHPDAFGKPASMGAVEGVAPQGAASVKAPEKHAEPNLQKPTAPSAMRH